MIKEVINWLFDGQVDLIGRIHWEDLGIIITKKTVNDFIRIYLKLLEFFEQQVSFQTAVSHYSPNRPNSYKMKKSIRHKRMTK